LADTLTPVNIYLKLRDVFAGSILLESSDYHGHENSLSFICCDPIASFVVNDHVAEIQFPDGATRKEPIKAVGQVTDLLDEFKNTFQTDATIQSKYITCGLFGYMAYDSVVYFEDVTIDRKEKIIPEMIYKLYRYVIVVDHFSNELNLFEHVIDPQQPSSLPKIEQIIFSNRFSTYKFSLTNGEQSNFTDSEFLDVIEKGKEHCYRGDVFQIVLSRRFTCQF